MDFQQILMAAAMQGGGAAAGPTELFPDPTLEDVTDDTNGWSYSGDMALGPTGGTGPGLSADGTTSGAVLAGTNNSALLAAWGVSTAKSVTVTFGSFTSGQILVSSRGGIPVSFSGPGAVMHTVTSGTDTVGADSFFMILDDDGCVAGLTGISVM